MEELGCEFRLSAEDWRDPQPRDMMMFCLYLYATMPQFVPKATIEYRGTLNEVAVKNIELTNPSSKPVPHCPPGKYGLSSNMMALLTSGCG